MSLLEDEAVQICADLIRIDTSAPYGGGGPGEHAAALYIQGRLAEVGIEAELFEAESGRTNVIARIRGSRRDALMLHSHLDVVTVTPEEWSIPPFAGEIHDEYLWGRGAIDMKNMVAAIIACARELARTGTVPARDLVLAFFADEENGTELGSKWMVAQHPDQFANVTTAVGEVGGFGITAADGNRVYFLETARKGVAWAELTTSHTEGHGSITRTDSAIARLSAAINRITSHWWPIEEGAQAASLIADVRECFGVDLTAAEADTARALAGVDELLRSSVRDVANVTVLRAGDSPNVVPGTASAIVDGRFLPGHKDDFLATLQELAGPDVEVRLLDLTPADVAPVDGPLVADIRRALQIADPGSRLLTYTSSAGTDSVSFAPLGIHGYGFVPQPLPAGYPYARLFHGVDERVPLSALHGAARTLMTLLTLPETAP